MRSFGFFAVLPSMIPRMSGSFIKPRSAICDLLSQIGDTLLRLRGDRCTFLVEADRGAHTLARSVQIATEHVVRLLRGLAGRHLDQLRLLLGTEAALQVGEPALGITSGG